MDTKSTFIIAEMSANHNGRLETALNTIEAIKESGADAVKIQTYKPESLTLNLDRDDFAAKTRGPWKGFTPWELYSAACTPYEWHHELANYSRSIGLEFFSSPFDFEAVDLLEQIEVSRYKIASFEITDTNLIRYAASKGRPMIISTGVAEIADIELAVSVCREVGNNDITLLKTTSEYPSKLSEANLLKMIDMKERFNCEIGVSDHTMGSIVPCSAVCLGATVVEKHFILDRKMGGVDSHFSMEPSEFKEMVQRVRETEKVFGSISYEVSEYDKSRRRSLYVVEDIKPGEFFTDRNVKSIRPGNGMAPHQLFNVLGKKAKVFLKKGTALKESFVG